MISPVTLSIVFLVITFIIVLGWTRLIFGSTRDEEEILKNIRQQMTTLASIKQETLSTNSDSLIDNLYNHLEDKNRLEAEKHRETSNNVTSTSTSCSPDTNMKTMEENLNKYMEEITKGIGRRCNPKKEVKLNVPKEAPKNKSGITIKRSKSYLNILEAKKQKSPCKIPRFGKKIKECGMGRLFLDPSRSASEVLLNKNDHQSRKPSAISTNCQTDTSSLHNDHSGSTSISQNILSSREFDWELKPKVRRHQSLSDKSHKPTIYIRKSVSSYESLFRKPSKQVIENATIPTFHWEKCKETTCPSQNPNRRRRRKGSPYRNSNKEDLLLKENIQGAPPGKWCEMYQPNLKTKEEYTVQLLSEISTNHDTKKLLSSNMYYPEKPEKQQKPQKHRPTSPQRHSNLTRNLCQSSEIGNFTERPTSTGSSSYRSKSCDQISSFTGGDDSSSNAYDFSLVFMETNAMRDLLPIAEKKLGALEKKSVPITLDKGTELSQPTLISQSMNATCEYCVDSTQTSFPKLVVQHLESYSAPVEEECCSSPNLELKDKENLSKIPKLTMPDLRLEKVSNSLRRSHNIIETKRNIIEELVKETRNLLNEQEEKNEQETRKKWKAKSRIPRSPTSSLNNSRKGTPRHSPLTSTNISLLSTPASSNHRLALTDQSKIKEKLDSIVNLQGDGDQINTLNVGIMEESGATRIELPEEVVNLTLKSELKAELKAIPNTLSQPPKPKAPSESKRHQEKPEKSSSPTATHRKQSVEHPKPKSPTKNKERSKYTAQNEVSKGPTKRPESADTTVSQTTDEKIWQSTKSDFSSRPVSPIKKSMNHKDIPVCIHGSCSQRPKSPKPVMKTDLRPHDTPCPRNFEPMYQDRPREIKEIDPDGKKERRRRYSPGVYPSRASGKSRSPIPAYARPPSPRTKKENFIQNPLFSEGTTPESTFIGQGIDFSRHDIPVYARPSSPRTKNFYQSTHFSEGTTTDPTFMDQGINMSRHDMACSTSYLKPHPSPPSPEDGHRRTRWTINPDLKKYQSYNYSSFYDQWYYPAPTSTNVAPNFYCVNESCRQVPFLQRSHSPGANSNGKNDAMRKVLHAKDIATRLNR